MKERILAEIDEKVRDLMKKHKVSPKTGFLAENPPRYLPKNTGNFEKDQYFNVLGGNGTRPTLTSISHASATRTEPENRHSAGLTDISKGPKRR